MYVCMYVCERMCSSINGRLACLVCVLIYSLFHWGDKLTTKPPLWELNESISNASLCSPPLSCTLRGQRYTQSVWKAGRSIASSLQRPGSSFSVGQKKEKSGVIEDCDPHDPSSLYLLVHSRVTINMRRNAVKKQEVVLDSWNCTK